MNLEDKDQDQDCVILGANRANLISPPTKLKGGTL